MGEFQWRDEALSRFLNRGPLWVIPCGLDLLGPFWIKPKWPPRRNRNLRIQRLSDLPKGKPNLSSAKIFRVRPNVVGGGSFFQRSGHAQVDIPAQ